MSAANIPPTKIARGQHPQAPRQHSSGSRRRQSHHRRQTQAATAGMLAALAVAAAAAVPQRCHSSHLLSSAMFHPWWRSAASATAADAAPAVPLSRSNSLRRDPHRPQAWTAAAAWATAARGRRRQRSSSLHSLRQDHQVGAAVQQVSKCRQLHQGPPLVRATAPARAAAGIRHRQQLSVLSAASVSTAAI